MSLQARLGEEIVSHIIVTLFLMSRFFSGDTLGNIKAITYTHKLRTTEQKTELVTVYEGQSNAVQKLAVSASDKLRSQAKLAAAYANGLSTVFKFDDEVNKLQLLQEWKETRINQSHFVGLHISENNVYSCTSNGALRLSLLPEETSEKVKTKLISLPSRLLDWRISPNQETFAYGGDEVELSVWNTELAFTPRQEDLSTSKAASKKRKRNDALFPGEIWRAKNVPNDFLGLRQPVRITSLAYLSLSAQHDILTGTQLGDVRRYDTRAGRRPVSDWHGIAKVGGVKMVEKGFSSEHEAFVSDLGSNLYSIDLRTGKIVYGYKGLSGAVNCIAPSLSRGILASTALDRYTRIHSTFPPPAEVGTHQNDKGQVLDRVFMKSTPTAIVWDGIASVRGGNSDGPDDEEVWDSMEQATK